MPSSCLIGKAGHAGGPEDGVKGLRDVLSVRESYMVLGLAAVLGSSQSLNTWPSVCRKRMRSMKECLYSRQFLDKIWPRRFQIYL